MHTFEIRDQFYLDGKPFKIISGGIHYFRVLPDYWRDRLEKLKAMGCNTVETYIPWNMHEPEPGEFHFDGLVDVVRFIKLAQELGLYVIVRPSPYICAEWELGGLPYWLLKEDGMRLRTCYEPFLQRVELYYQKLIPLLTPLQIQCGGPVIMMQVENEYGYYGDDAVYLERMKQMMIDLGVEVLLVTSDGPFDESLTCGSIEGVLPTGNFGSRTKERFEVLQKYTNGGPLMCTEFWVGWFDHWGNGGHMTGKLDENIRDLDKMLELGHVNIYMFEGGTNFGFMNGSNYYDALTPDITSYDYDAVLREDGSLTPKYEAFKTVIAKYAEIPEVDFSTHIVKKAYGTISLSRRTGLFSNLDNLAHVVESVCPVGMEKLGQGYGYTMYQSVLRNESKLEKLRLWDANDRANIYVGEEAVLTLYDRELLTEHALNVSDCQGKEIRILTENMGRVNFGPLMERQRKGINGTVQLNGHQHFYWKQYCLPMNNLEQLNWEAEYKGGLPAFYEFQFSVDEPGDTYLDFEGWGKGCILVNGFNIGRFWEIGPQGRLYIPAPLLKQGENTIIIFETEGKSKDTVVLHDAPLWR